jgi:hypothetical protein
VASMVILRNKRDRAAELRRPAPRFPHVGGTGESGSTAFPFTESRQATPGLFLLGSVQDCLTPSACDPPGPPHKGGGTAGLHPSRRSLRASRYEHPCSHPRASNGGRSRTASSCRR